MRFFRTSPEKLPAAESEMIFSKQDLKQLLLPLLAEQFLVVLIGMMDTIMVSYCGESAMSGRFAGGQHQRAADRRVLRLGDGRRGAGQPVSGAEAPGCRENCRKDAVLCRFARFAGEQQRFA